MKEDIISFVQNERLPFCVTMCGISYCDGSYRIVRNNSEINVIEYIISGCGTVSVRGDELNTKEGDIYFLKKGENHLYYSDLKTPWVKIWMNFSGTLADRIIESYRLYDTHIFHAPELKEYFFEIYKTAGENIGAKAVSEKCAIIFLELAQRLADFLSEKEKYDIAELVKQYIDDTNDFSFNIDDIAEKFSYSKNHIIRAFKSKYKVTPYEYMQKRRMDVAESLLKNTVYSVAEVAEKLSFCDARYFSGCFSKRYGIPPNRYRKQR